MAVNTIVVLGTGGTIAGRAGSARDNVGYTAAQVGVAELMAGLSPGDGWRIEAEQVAQLDSKDMEPAVWVQLARRCAAACARDDVAGVVVTHGTDTLEETAFFLQATLSTVKPVVLTGAMRPATSSAADGPRNLADALAVAAAPGAAGVVVAFAGEVHAAAEVAKAHTYRLDAFWSGDAGPLGYVEEAAVRLLRPWPSQRGAFADRLPGPTAGWPPVEIVMSHAGASGRLVDAAVAAGVRGLVVAGTGNGTVHRALEAALLAAQEQGVKVLRASRCPQGRILPHGGDRLPHTDLSPVKARIALMLELAAAA